MAARPRQFSARTITWVQFTVTSSAGSDVRLAEIEVWQTAAKSADVSGDDDFNPANVEVPRQFSLSPIYPNPFSANGTFGNAETVFQLHLPENGQVSAVIYDLTGKEIKRVYDGMMSPGRLSLRWDGKNQNSHVVGTGVYLLQVQYTGSSGIRETAIQRLVLLK